MPTLHQQVAEVFSLHGPLAAALPHYQPRAGQQQMATAVADILSHQGILTVEAGTGIGKTFAYLVPALLAKQKIIVSTGTKHLQDQLFHRDLPNICRALHISPTLALLKGRANYLCLQRLTNYYEQDYFNSRSLLAEIQQVKAWSITTESGDIAELTELSEAATIWPYVTSTVDNCLGQDCEFYQSCFLVKARRAAQEADVLVINHHLFFADLVLRDIGFGELLPGVNAVIFDEAHQLPEIASQFFTSTLSSRQIRLLLQDILQSQQKEAKDDLPLIELTKQVDTQLIKAREAFGHVEQKNAWANIRFKPQLQSELGQLQQQLTQLVKHLESIATRGKEIERCWERGCNVMTQLANLLGETPSGHIHWFETTRHHFLLHLTPTTIAENFQRILQGETPTWIFTSATLTTGKNNFQHFAQSLGLSNLSQLLQIESPFNFTQQALLYLPSGLPNPQATDYTETIVATALPLIETNQGRTFFLFTSHQALQRAAELLRSMTKLPLLVQGSLPKRQLLKQYLTLGNAVLLGTHSFWEGVDVRGNALSLVIIDKLPFARPDDPLLKGRMNLLKQQGLDPFLSYQLPQAVILLKQGVGRLIRDYKDRGVLMLCDPRITNESYGEVFLAGLPPMTITRHQTDALKFLVSLREKQDDTTTFSN